MIRGKCTDYSRCACVACWLDPNVAKASDGLEEARSYFRNIRCADCSFGTSVTRNEKVYKWSNTYGPWGKQRLTQARVLVLFTWEEQCLRGQQVDGSPFSTPAPWSSIILESCQDRQHGRMVALLLHSRKALSWTPPMCQGPSYVACMLSLCLLWSKDNLWVYGNWWF